MLAHTHYMMLRGKLSHLLWKWSFGTKCLAQALTYRICIPYFLLHAPDNYLCPFVSASPWRPPTPSCSQSACSLSKPTKQVQNKGGDCLSSFTAGKNSIWPKIFLSESVIIWQIKILRADDKDAKVQRVRIKKDAAHLKIICLLQRQFISSRQSDVYIKRRITVSYLYGSTHHLVFET